jgi:hypothetical protein
MTKLAPPPEVPLPPNPKSFNKVTKVSLVNQYSNQYQNRVEDQKVTNMSLLGNENFPYRRSQERGNQRMLSGSGGKSGSRVVSIAGRSGYMGENSAHAGGKKDSVNSNLT